MKIGSKIEDPDAIRTFEKSYTYNGDSDKVFITVENRPLNEKQKSGNELMIFNFVAVPP